MKRCKIGNKVNTAIHQLNPLVPFLFMRLLEIGAIHQSEYIKAIPYTPYSMTVFSVQNKERSCGRVQRHFEYWFTHHPKSSFFGCYRYVDGLASNVGSSAKLLTCLDKKINQIGILEISAEKNRIDDKQQAHLHKWIQSQ